jgi:hypothetical protein
VYIPPTRPSSPTLVVNGQTITANPQGNFVIGTQTESLDNQGNLVIGTQTFTSNPQGNFVVGSQTVSIDAQGDLVIGTTTITPNAQGNFVLGAETITTNGQAVTISGTTVSVGTSKSMGAMIAGFIGATTTETKTASASSPLVQFTGAARRLEIGLFEGSLIVGGILGVIVGL